MAVAGLSGPEPAGSFACQSFEPGLKPGNPPAGKPRLPVVANGRGVLPEKPGARNEWGLLSIPTQNPAFLRAAEHRVLQSPKIKAQWGGDSTKQPNLPQKPSLRSIKTQAVCSPHPGCFAS